MKTIQRLLTAFAISLTLLTSSCRKEESVFIEAPPEQILEANSNVASLLQRTAMNDGSDDNIVDNSSCFNIELPATVAVNGLEIIVDSEEDFDTIEDIFDEFDDDDDSLQIMYPITIVLSDFTEVIINNMDEFENYSDGCSGENENDDDIECVDIEYPVTASVFNNNNELLETINIMNDEDLYYFVDELDEDDIVNIGFPITVILSDGTQMDASNLDELENIIDNAKDDCDEDDDNDFNDDDCNNCTTNQLSGFLVGCSDWTVDKLERNDNDLEDMYVGYLFNFMADGTLSASTNSDSFSGTWESSGTGNDISVLINIPNLTDFNANWNLHELNQNSGETKVDLRINGEDRLRFESSCTGINDGSGNDNIDDTALVQALTTGDWYVTYYFDDFDETTDFDGFVFNYTADGTATATSPGETTNGSWSTSSGDETPLELNLNYGIASPLDGLAEDWDVLEVTSEIIRLKDISGGDGSTDFLTFERTPDGVGGDDLGSIVSDGVWSVSSYLDNGIDETIDYNGYNLTFNTDGTAVADNGAQINGTWSIQNAGNKFVLDFGSSIPFDEFNDDWDVISVTDSQIQLQDVSGGGGGTDTLIFNKQ